MAQAPFQLDHYISHTLMRDLVGHDHRPSAYLLYLWLAMEAQRTGAPVPVSYASLAEETGLSRSAAQTAVGWLRRRKLVSVQQATVTSTPVYTVHAPWRQRGSVAGSAVPRYPAATP